MLTSLITVRRVAPVVIAVAGVALGMSCTRERAADTEPVVAPTPVAAAPAEQVHAFCGACHKYPSPDIFPRSVWRQEIRQAYDFMRGSTLTIDYPPFEAVARYYEDGAPERLAQPDLGAREKVLEFKREGLSPPSQPPHPGVANVSAARLLDDHRDDIIVCDMRFGRVLAYQAYATPPAWRTLAEVPHPCHAEVIDLDGDGRRDLLIADLGDFA